MAEYRPHVVSHRKPLAGNLKDRDRVREAVLVSEKWSVFEPKNIGNFMSPTAGQTKLMISARIREHLYIRKPFFRCLKDGIWDGFLAKDGLKIMLWPAINWYSNLAI